jgi:hypothetical protein
VTLMPRYPHARSIFTLTTASALVTADCGTVYKIAA